MKRNKKSKFQMFLDFMGQPISGSDSIELNEGRKAYWEAIGLRDAANQEQKHQHIHLHDHHDKINREIEIQEELLRNEEDIEIRKKLIELIELKKEKLMSKTK